MLRIVLPVAGLLTFGIGSILAQTAPPPPAPPRPADPARPGVVPAAGTTTEAPGHAYRVKQILGTKVSIKGDLSIGTVDDLVFSDGGQVEYLIVNNDGKLVTVPWEAAKFNFDKRTATVLLTFEIFVACEDISCGQSHEFLGRDVARSEHGGDDLAAVLGHLVPVRLRHFSDQSVATQ
jgi:PRC-barrel domain